MAGTVNKLQTIHFGLSADRFWKSRHRSEMVRSPGVATLLGEGVDIVRARRDKRHENVSGNIVAVCNTSGSKLATNGPDLLYARICSRFDQIPQASHFLPLILPTSDRIRPAMQSLRPL